MGGDRSTPCVSDARPVACGLVNKRDLRIAIIAVLAVIVVKTVGPMIPVVGPAVAGRL
jgi:hypothetical protein